MAIGLIRAQVLTMRERALGSDGALSGMVAPKSSSRELMPNLFAVCLGAAPRGIGRVRNFNFDRSRSPGIRSADSPAGMMIYWVIYAALLHGYWWWWLAPITIIS